LPRVENGSPDPNNRGDGFMKSWMKSSALVLALLPVVLFASTQPVEAG
jgi:hypothetical protein